MSFFLTNKIRLHIGFDIVRWSAISPSYTPLSPHLWFNMEDDCEDAITETFIKEG